VSRPQYRRPDNTGASIRFPRSDPGHPSGESVESRPRLLDAVRTALRTRRYSVRTEKAYVGWIRRFILFHAKRHPETMGEPEIGAYLSHLATDAQVSASTQNQALAAILFLYQEVLRRELAWLGDLVHAKRPARVPVVLNRDEVRAVLRGLSGPPYLVSALLYGAGLRLLEALQLRVKDVDLARREVTVRRGKGQKDRRTVLPGILVDPLRAHLATARAQHLEDVRLGAGFVALPDALAGKYPSAPREWIWQWVFPATRTYVDRETGRTHRHHLHETVIQRAAVPQPQRPQSPKRSAPTPCAIRSRRISWKAATTSAPSRSSSATRTSVRQ
jgi:integron integrase